MNVIPTALNDVLVIEPRVFGDHRGFFLESWNERRYASVGIDVDFVQDNLSQSTRGTLRGLHYQVPGAQGKLVSVLQGEVFDVAVDVRSDSPTFGHWVSVVLSAENRRQVYIPPGFAHGFCVTSETALFTYKCTGYYAPEEEATVAWNDPELAIDWPVSEPILSEKDRKGIPLKEISLDRLLSVEPLVR